MRSPTAHSNRMDGLINTRVVWSDGELFDDTVPPVEMPGLGGPIYLPPGRIIVARLFPEIRHAVAEFDHITDSGVAVYLEVTNDV